MRKKKARFLCHIDHLEFRRLLSTIFVSSAATGGSNDGTSWTNAYTSLQTALTAAGAAATSNNPVVVEVGQGTYKPTSGSDRTATFGLIDNVTIEGGFAGTGQSNPDARNTAMFPTILSGDIGMVGNNFDNSYNVVNSNNSDSTAVLDGFTISDGNANGAGDGDGAGILDSGSGAAISNCIITGNNAAFGGGGLYLGGSTTTLTHCTITGNTAATSGGGIYARGSTLDLVDCTISQNKSYSSGGGILANSDVSDTFTDCTITGNSATFDGAGIDNILSPETLSNCNIDDNTAGQNGGGMKIDGASPTLTDCTISGNTATNTGGGMYNNSASAVLTDCILTGNSASAGGAIGDNSSPTHFTNCIFSGNSATNIGGGTSENSSAAIFLNCTFSGNSAVNSGGGIFNNSSNTPLTNCILWNDSASSYGEIANNSSTPTITFSDVDQSGITGTGDIDVDPLFLRNSGTNGPTDYGDLHLRPNSPAIDIGSNSAISGTNTDADGKPRIINSTVDLGVYEYQILFVDSHATGSNNGTSWANAFTSLQTALADATSGTPIDVAQGTYYPTSGSSTAATFQLKDGVAIYGGFAGDSTSTPGTRDPKLYPTILSGNIGDQSTNSDNSNNVVTGSGTNSTAVLDGFTITAGNAEGGGKPYDGGGIYDNDGSPTINDCIITGNTSSVDNGGGIYNGNGSSPMITNTTISDNSAFSVGGGIENRGNSSPTLINCSITGNTAQAAGGGIYDYSSATFIDCLITGNSAPGKTGFPTSGNGGGIFNGNNAVLTLTNCTIADNTAAHGGGIYNEATAAPIITNSILWNDSPNEIVSSRAPNITYSDIDQSGFAGSNHNLDTDPHFVNSGGGDFRLEPTSPGVDVGLNSAIAGTDTDLNGVPRISNSTVDMGAYEFLPTIFVDANATGANTGGSWANAVTTLTEALSVAIAGSGQTINVAQGTYKPTGTTNRTISFQLLDDVSLFGGFAGDTTANPGQQDPSLYPTILSGDIGASGNSDNSYHVVSANDVSASTILDGFTITGGNANGVLPKDQRGGGIYADGSGEQINDCIISGNSAGTLGAGLFESLGEGTTLTNCMITGNTGPAFGGGGLYAHSTNMAVIDSVIAGNSGWRGGGIFNASSHLTLTNCTISGNAATDSGGGLYDDGNTSLNNCILWGDTAQNEGNEIFSGSNSTVTVAFSDIDQSGYAGSNNNIDTDPMFIDAAQDNYHIKVVSPAANAGLNSAIAGTDTDLDGNPRINDGTVDMGAYETWPIIYVDASATGTNDGSSFANAFTTLTAALAHALFNSGETIYVAQGTYKPTTGANRNASFGLIDGVGIDGGFAGDSTANPSQRNVSLFPTILSGDIGTIGDNSDNSYHVVYSDGANATALLDGFTITGGNANDSTHYQNDGGGIINLDGSPTISDCIISGNTATNDGGGMYNRNASPIVSYCTVSGNTSSYSGGGIYNQDHSSPILTNCIISGNSADGNGGAIYNNDYSSPILTNCIISGNSARSDGGGIDDWNSSPTLVNCTISGNTANSNGGGIWNDHKSAPTIINSIIWADTAGKEIYNDGTSSVTITYSDINPADIVGTASLDSTDINTDPQFVRAVGANGASDFGDLHILDTSPAVNVGSNAAISGTSTDLDGNARIVSGTVDMGAYEARLIHLIFDVSPPITISAGASFGAEVDIEDGNGNDVTTSDNSSVTIQIASGPAGVSLQGTNTLTVQNGETIFSGLNITQVGTYTISASDGSIPGATTSSFTITAAAANMLVFASQPADAKASQSLSPFTVEVEDQFGNIVTSDTSSVTIASTPSGASATVSAVAGIATFSNLAITASGTYSLTASDGSLTSATSSSFTISAVAPALLVISVQPANSIAGQAISPITVEVKDQSGNLVDGSSVTLSIATGPSNSRLGGTLTVSTTNGIATFDDVILDRAGAFTLTASDGSLSTATNSFTITYAGPQLVFITEPTNIVAGAKIPAFRVSPEDINGNPLLTNKSKITIRSSAGKLLGTSTATVKNGVAIFKNLSFQQAGSYTFQVSDAGFGSALSSTITVSPAAPAKMVFNPQPASVAHGTPFNVSVELQDKYGNAVDDGSTVDLVFGSHPSTAASLNLTSAVSDGVADFDGITLNATGNYTFKASDGKSKATSKKFVVS